MERAAQEVPAAGGVAEAVTGEIRVLEDRCGTCVLNPARTAIRLPVGRRAEFISQTRAEQDGFVVCHRTFGEDVPPGTREAMCRGYVNAYGLPPAVREALDRGIGHLVEVPDPLAAGKDRPEEEQDRYRQWLATGEVECAACGTTVRCANLESLPDHRCTERQRARRSPLPGN
ncbi:hypothetical protein [Streptomyces sp. W1SF4]|uniref:hypothetical protein n=1 Tax=Streptomyces sp. W1SF4 TaxID=2305220 RepID=UPI000F6B596F|nr:hypothetical protein [Streptomyces sp. W1SF4]AZM93911.1 hypothetical protein D1J60_36070 [Streptomyces sp. W1SF4]